MGGYYTGDMPRAISALLFVAFTHGAFSQELPSWFAQSLLVLPEEIADAAREKKRVVLYFEQDGCPYCKRMAEVTFRDPAVAKRMQERFVTIGLNIWGDREVTAPGGKTMSEKQLTSSLRIQFTPTLIFFDEQGEVALRLNGYYPPERFLAAIEGQGRTRSTQGKRKPGGKPVVLLFDAPACAACEDLKTTLRHDSVAKQLAAFSLERLPLSGARAKELGVGEAPTMVLFDAAGGEVIRLEAYFRPFHVAGSLEYVASGAYKSEPSFQRFLQDRAERMRRAGQRVDLWN